MNGKRGRKGGGRGARDGDSDLLRVHMCVLICVCVRLQEVCDLLAFVMEMDPAGPAR